MPHSYKRHQRVIGDELVLHTYQARSFKSLWCLMVLWIIYRLPNQLLDLTYLHAIKSFTLVAASQNTYEKKRMSKLWCGWGVQFNSYLWNVICIDGTSLLIALMEWWFNFLNFWIIFRRVDISILSLQQTKNTTYLQSKFVLHGTTYSVHTGTRISGILIISGFPEFQDIILDIPTIAGIPGKRSFASNIEANFYFHFWKLIGFLTKYNWALCTCFTSKKKENLI